MPQTQTDPVSEAYDQLIGDNPETGADDNDIVPDDIYGGTDEQEPEDAPDDDNVEGETEVEDAEDGDTDEDHEQPEESDEEDPEGPVELDDEAKVRLKDGTEVTLAELREGALRRDDYTRKTQELADQRRELEEQREKIDRFTSAFDDDPVGVLEKLVTSQKQPTHAVAHLLKGLADSGVLEEDFVRTFIPEGGAVRQKAGEAAEQDRLSKIEQQLEQRQREERQQLERQETIATFERQWTSAVEKAGLKFESAEQEQELLREVLQYGVDNEITNIEAAYAAYAWNNDLPRGGQKRQRDEGKTEKARQKKKATGAITRRSAGSGRTVKPRPASDEEAISEAWDEVMAGFAS